MSKLEKLIQKLCPNGVVYTKIIDICEISRGVPISKEDIINNAGEYPVYSSQTKNNGELGKIATYSYNGEYLTWTTDGSNAGSVFYRLGKFSVTNVCGLLKVIDERIMTRYVYYALSISASNYVNYGMGNPKLMSTAMSKIKIPIPPISIQKEIVNILDNFTYFITELTLELKARKKQYEYYRNCMLKENSKYTQKKLGDICKFVRGPFGSSLKKEFFTNKGYAVYEQQHAINRDFKIRYFVSEDKFNQMKRFAVKTGDLIMSCSGTMGKISIITEDSPKGIINQALLKLTAKNGIDSKYLKYCFENSIASQFNYSARGGAIKNVASVSVLKEIKICIPPLEEQQLIVDILDRFDKLCNDINTGLPAEIELRQKQYEYYRHKLLSFKEMSL